MASNESTPDRVLYAPQLTPVNVHEAIGPNRRERRLQKIAEVLNTPYLNPAKRARQAARAEKLARRKGK